MYGGYYWYPAPGPDGVQWSLLTCEDLGFASDQGHPDLWPAVIDRLAITWGKNATALRRHLKDYYRRTPTGPCHQAGRYLILHGDDAPVADWLTIVIRRFRLERSAIECCSTNMSAGSRTIVAGSRVPWESFRSIAT